MQADNQFYDPMLPSQYPIGWVFGPKPLSAAHVTPRPGETKTLTATETERFSNPVCSGAVWQKNVFNFVACSLRLSMTGPKGSFANTFEAGCRNYGLEKLGSTYEARKVPLYLQPARAQSRVPGSYN